MTSNMFILTGGWTGPVTKTVLAKNRVRQDRKKQKALGGGRRNDIDNEFITKFQAGKNHDSKMMTIFNYSEFHLKPL